VNSADYVGQFYNPLALLILLWGQGVDYGAHVHNFPVRRSGCGSLTLDNY